MSERRKAKGSDKKMSWRYSNSFFFAKTLAHIKEKVYLCSVVLAKTY